jgi:hypothetical protein
MTLSIPSHAANDSVDVWLPNLPEYSYSFEAVSRNAEGTKRSIAYPFTASSYGDLFQASLTNRLSEYARHIGGKSLEIKWFGAIERAVGTEVFYTDTDNQSKIRFVPISEAITTIQNVKGDISYRTLYLPEETAVDTFYTESIVPQITLVP